MEPTVKSPSALPSSARSSHQGVSPSHQRYHDPETADIFEKHYNQAFSSRKSPKWFDGKQLRLLQDARSADDGRSRAVARRTVVRRTIGAESKAQAERAKVGALSSIIALLESDDHSSQVIAVRALKLQSQNPDMRALITAMGGLESLSLILIKNTMVRMGLHAAEALKNLATDATSKRRIAHAGAVVPLVTILQQGSDLERHIAASTLNSLATEDDLKIVIYAAGACEPLIEQLESGNSGISQLAAATLQKLAEDDGIKHDMLELSIAHNACNNARLRAVINGADVCEANAIAANMLASSYFAPEPQGAK